MKTTTCLRNSINLILLFLSLPIFCQQEARWWYFGRKAGFDFGATLSNPTMLNNGSQNNGDVDEGHASICDSNGILLFYTNGLTIWDKNGASMNNGTGLMGDWSATQCATIFPVPGSKTRYYVITTPRTGSGNQVRYNIVDMDPATNGGFATGSVLTKNQVMPGCGPYMMEALVSCPHFNGTDIWVVAHGSDNSSAALTDDGNKFYVWRVSSSGISAVTTYALGYDYPFDGSGGVPRGIGIMKFNSCFNRLFISYYNATSHIEGFRFDNNTGQVLNWPAPINAPLYLGQYKNSGGTLAAMGFAYGVEVSPNGRYLYVTLSGEGAPGKELQQFDLQAGTGTTADIQNSATRITPAAADGVRYGQLQLGPDGKIYHTLHNWNVVGGGGYCKISVINNPNADGSGAGSAGYTEGQYTWPGSATGVGSTMGLPSFHKGFLAGIASVIPAGALSGLDQVCVGEPADFEANYTQNGNNWRWNIDANVGPNTTDEYTTQNITHTYSTAGNYEVVLKLNDATCGYEVTERTTIKVNPVVNSAGTVNCSPESGTVTAPNAAYGYAWYADAAGTQLLNVGTVNVPLPLGTSGNVYLRAVSSTTTGSAVALTNGPLAAPNDNTSSGLTFDFTVSKSVLNFQTFQWRTRDPSFSASPVSQTATITIRNTGTSEVLYTATQSVVVTAPSGTTGVTYTQNVNTILPPGNYRITFSGIPAILRHRANWNGCTPNINDAQLALIYNTAPVTECIATNFNYTLTPVSAATLACSRMATIPYSCPLPVSWLDFTGEKVDGGNLLSWHTASEHNASHFEIERSTDGVTFQYVGLVEARGNSQQISAYTFVDKIYTDAPVYYRLKQADLDANYEYSRIIRIDNQAASIRLQPNPGDGLVYLQGASDGALANVLDVHGRIIYSSTITAEGILDLRNTSKGMYLIQVIEMNEAQVLRYVKE